MAAAGEELDLADTLRVAGPGVDAPLRNERLLEPGLGRLEVDVDVGRDVEVRPAEVVVQLLAWMRAPVVSLVGPDRQSQRD